MADYLQLVVHFVEKGSLLPKLVNFISLELEVGLGLIELGLELLVPASLLVDGFRHARFTFSEDFCHPVSMVSVVLELGLVGLFELLEEDVLALELLDEVQSLFLEVVDSGLARFEVDH